jgi:hypothetical protein
MVVLMSHVPGAADYIQGYGPVLWASCDKTGSSVVRFDDGFGKEEPRGWRRRASRVLSGQQ